MVPCIGYEWAAQALNAYQPSSLSSAHFNSAAERYFYHRLPNAHHARSQFIIFRTMYTLEGLTPTLLTIQLIPFENSMPLIQFLSAIFSPFE